MLKAIDTFEVVTITTAVPTLDNDCYTHLNLNS